MSYEFERHQAARRREERKETDMQRVARAVRHLQAAHREIERIQSNEWVDRAILGLGHSAHALVEAARTLHISIPPELQDAIDVLQVGEGVSR